MLQTSERETEILLGNKQLLGIFFVVAILLGIAFTGGYIVGRGTALKREAAAALVATQTAAPGNGTSTPGETHSIPPDSADTGPGRNQPSNVASSASSQPKLTPQANPAAQDQEPPPLGSPERKTFEQLHPAASEPASSSSAADFSPQAGQEFLQVAAVGRDEAEAIADVLRKKGLPAHAVAKPGNTKIYRVLIGPIQDAADLSSTRESLRKTGFREVIVQKY